MAPINRIADSVVSSRKPITANAVRPAITVKPSNTNRLTALDCTANPRATSGETASGSKRAKASQPISRAGQANNVACDGSDVVELLATGRPGAALAAWS